jgi:D-beta-D-heptose 7-phosphate kinase/D-beta-D-heptose 1-phosphate adenosyltransferase
MLKRLQNSSPKVALFGDVMLDIYLIGSADRISPEAPVQVCDISEEREVLGGAGNVAKNLEVFGAKVSLFSVIGKDSAGDRILEMLKGSDTTGVFRDSSRKTTQKSRVLSKHQQIVRFDRENREEISETLADEVLKEFRNRVSEFDIVLISDYKKGFISEKISKGVIEISNSQNLKTLIDPKGEDYEKYRNAWLVKPNRKELYEAGGNGKVDEIGKRTLEKFNFQNLLVTLSEDGMKLFQKGGKEESFPTKAKEIFDVTGAGDTVLSSLAFGLGSGETLSNSIELSNSATAVVIGKVGTATVTLNELLETQKKRIHSWKEISEVVTKAKREHKRVVFTNGCFDILHIGHVKYLEEAKSFGDILIVGINSDASVRRLKGDNRPINVEEERAYLISSLDVVDFVTIFPEDTPYELISEIRPHTLVKGGDYKGKEVVGSDLVDEVKLVSFVKDRSTTKIIEKCVT